MLIPQFLRRKISLLLTIDDWIKDRQGTTAGTAPSAHILEFGPPVLAGVDLLVAVAESVERVQGQTWSDLLCGCGPRFAPPGTTCMVKGETDKQRVSVRFSFENFRYF